MANAKTVKRDELRVKLPKREPSHGPTVLQEFHWVTKLLWHQRKASQRLRDAVIKGLHKTNGETECGNYHSISLVAHAVRILLKIVATRLSAYCKAKILIPKD